MVQLLGARDLVIYPLFLPDVVIHKVIKHEMGDKQDKEQKIDQIFLTESLSLYVKMVNGRQECLIRLNLKEDLGTKPLVKMHFDSLVKRTARQDREVSG